MKVDIHSRGFRKSGEDITKRAGFLYRRMPHEEVVIYKLLMGERSVIMK